MAARPIDDVYAIVREEMEKVLLAEGLPDVAPAYWVVVQDEQGVATSRLQEGDVAPTEVLHRLTHDNPGVTAAALVSYVRPHGEACLLAAVNVPNPGDSDVRSAPLVDRDDAVGLGPWHYTV